MQQPSGAQNVVVGAPSTMGDDYQLNTTTLIRHAARNYPEHEIVFRTPDGGWDRYTYADSFKRVAKAANALSKLGVGAGDRVGVIDWNSKRFFESYWSIPGLGAVLVQLNLRLGEEDLTFVVDHSDTSLILVDETLLPVAEKLAEHCKGVKGWVVMSDKPMSEIETSLSPVYHYEDLIADEPDTYDWPMIDENSAYGACYTTGTTGRPKGVYYSHRSIYLHSNALVINIQVTSADCMMLVTPMFHANCWGFPQAAALAGCKIVLPGRFAADDLSPLTKAMIDEGVTVANGAPAIFGPMLQQIRNMDEKPDFSNSRFISGATEPPLSLMKGLRELTGAEVIHAYGATETTPIVTLNRLKPALADKLSEDERWDLKRCQGIPLSGLDVRIVDASGEELPWDGESAGELFVRGPWITAKYYKLEDEQAERFSEDGFWRSGDAATFDTNGYMKLTDRLKDVIKSGGEWISSIDMENHIAAHPKVREAAVIGVPHPEWQERPVAIVAVLDGEELSEDEIRDHLAPHFAKWQLPDRIIFSDEVPKTSVGKADKKRMRAQHGDIYEKQQ